MIRHPHYPTGEPVQLGDRFRRTDRWKDGRLITRRVLTVASIRYVRHNDEVWIHPTDKTFGTSCEIVHAADMRLVARANPLDTLTRVR